MLGNLRRVSVGACHSVNRVCALFGLFMKFIATVGMPTMKVNEFKSNKKK